MSKSSLYTRVLTWDSGLPGAFELLTAFPDSFLALLEDPLGGGRDMLISRAGQSISITAEEVIKHPARGDDFFSRWRRSLQSVDSIPGSSAIRCLVYAAYEAGSMIEELPKPKSSPDGPLIWLHFPAWSCIYIPDRGEIHLSVLSDAAMEKEKLDQIEAMIRQCSVLQPGPEKFMLGSIDTADPAAYIQAVLKAKEYIRSGDIFQANIARFWSAEADDGIGLSIYSRLRRVNPAPFFAYLDIRQQDDRLQIISASPERLFRLHSDGCMETRPIAGTRQRAVGERDATLGSEMLVSEKERAEHIMLVDLERNDMGRICQPGTIEVNERMLIERYATVQHIVSNVRGRLAAGRDIVDLFRAMFPGGTITGCPKVRCMQIIHELEGRARGPYTGAVGYLGWDGSADMNILIRTFWLYKNRLHWAAGAGIVADSDPEFELAETGHKAEGLLRALPTAASGFI